MPTSPAPTSVVDLSTPSMAPATTNKSLAALELPADRQVSSSTGVSGTHNVTQYVSINPVNEPIRPLKYTLVEFHTSSAGVVTKWTSFYDDFKAVQELEVKLLSDYGLLKGEFAPNNQAGRPSQIQAFKDVGYGHYSVVLQTQSVVDNALSSIRKRASEGQLLNYTVKQNNDLEEQLLAEKSELDGVTQIINTMVSDLTQLRNNLETANQHPTRGVYVYNVNVFFQLIGNQAMSGNIARPRYPIQSTTSASPAPSATGRSSNLRSTASASTSTKRKAGDDVTIDSHENSSVVRLRSKRSKASLDASPHIPSLAKKVRHSGSPSTLCRTATASTAPRQTPMSHVLSDRTAKPTSLDKFAYANAFMSETFKSQMQPQPLASAPMNKGPTTTLFGTSSMINASTPDIRLQVFASAPMNKGPKTTVFKVPSMNDEVTYPLFATGEPSINRESHRTKLKNLKIEVDTAEKKKAGIDSEIKAVETQLEELKSKAEAKQRQNEELKVINNDLVKRHEELQKSIDKANTIHEYVTEQKTTAEGALKAIQKQVAEAKAELKKVTELKEHAVSKEAAEPKKAAESKDNL